MHDCSCSGRGVPSASYSLHARSIDPGVPSASYNSHVVVGSDVPPDLEEKVKFFSGKKKRTLGKCSNFFVFQPILIKIYLESDLVLSRPFPGSFYDLMILGTSYNGVFSTERQMAVN